MTREYVQEQYGAASDEGGPRDRMADEIVRLREELTGAQNTAVVSLEAMQQLRERLAAVEAERDKARQWARLWKRAASIIRGSEHEWERMALLEQDRARAGRRVA